MNVLDIYNPDSGELGLNLGPILLIAVSDCPIAAPPVPGAPAPTLNTVVEFSIGTCSVPFHQA